MIVERKKMAPTENTACSKTFQTSVVVNFCFPGVPYVSLQHDDSSSGRSHVSSYFKKINLNSCLAIVKMNEGLGERNLKLIVRFLVEFSSCNSDESSGAKLGFVAPQTSLVLSPLWGFDPSTSQFIALSFQLSKPNITHKNHKAHLWPVWFHTSSTTRIFGTQLFMASVCWAVSVEMNHIFLTLWGKNSSAVEDS